MPIAVKAYDSAALGRRREAHWPVHSLQFVAPGIGRELAVIQSAQSRCSVPIGRKRARAYRALPAIVVPDRRYRTADSLKHYSVGLS